MFQIIFYKQLSHYITAIHLTNRAAVFCSSVLKAFSGFHSISCNTSIRRLLKVKYFHNLSLKGSKNELTSSTECKSPH